VADNRATLYHRDPSSSLILSVRTPQRAQASVYALSIAAAKTSRLFIIWGSDLDAHQAAPWTLATQFMKTEIIRGAAHIARARESKQAPRFHAASETRNTRL
jgi:hypothetical protein